MAKKTAPKKKLPAPKQATTKTAPAKRTKAKPAATTPPKTPVSEGLPKGCIIDADGLKRYPNEHGVMVTLVERPLRKTIERLTDEELAKMREYHERFLRICTSTEPAEWDVAEVAIRANYKLAKLPEPLRYLKANSPTTALIAGPISDLIVQTGCNPEITIQNTLELIRRAANSGRASMELCKEISIEEVERCLRSVDYIRQDGKEFDETGASLEDIKVTIRNNGFQYRLIQPWGGWFSYCAYVREVLGLDIPEWAEYINDEQMARSCHLVWFGDATAVICDRPERFCVEVVPSADGRGLNVCLHSEDGPCLKYRNEDWGLWFIHNVQVTRQIVMAPETQTIKEIDAENNQEVRRIRIERFAGADKSSGDGWHRYIGEAKAKTIDSRRNDIDNQDEILVEMKDKTRRILVSDPSTGRCYCLGVPRDIATCADAQNWMSHGLDRFAVSRS